MAEGTTLDKIGRFARRAREAISPWQMFSPSDVASFAPGGGMVQASRENFPEALKAYRAGDYGGMARETAAGLLGMGGDMLWAAGPVVGATAGTAAKAAGKRIGKIGKSTDLPNLRVIPVDEAVKIAKRDIHLIPSGDRSEGFYVGGPRVVQNKRQLNKIRGDFDQYIAADPRGMDWYDRYRDSVTEVTGGNPKDNLWMTNTHGQFSAGVAPDSELAFSLKENNAWLAGMPVKAARPAQHAAMGRAIEANDPGLFQLGNKTGEYARRVNPDQPGPQTATGVNDFRHARNFRYTDAGGGAQREGMQPTQHRFLDYETAAAVGRANDIALGGRTDWTGERLQAAPWVRQKALDILDQRPKILGQARARVAMDNGIRLKRGAALPPELEAQAQSMAYETAAGLANKTIGDFYDKHTAFATHEAFPGADTGHLPGSVNASAAMREAYSSDPRSSWANAPGGRDAIYGGMRLGDTGIAMRTRPTVDMQGLYTPPSGVTETNPGQVARPLVAFDAGKVKSVAPADEAILNAGEAVRGYVDAQNAAAWHKPWLGGQPGKSGSAFFGMDRPATEGELRVLRDVGGRLGLPDVVDTGRGVTVTNFENAPGALNMKALKQIGKSLPDATSAARAKVDAGYIPYVDQWREGVGSGAATREMLSYVNKTPELRAALNQNPYIPQNAINRMERDAEWSKQFGATREDIQNARRIIGEGPGWIDRLEAALKNGAILPAIGLAVLGGSAALQQRDPRQAGAPLQF